MNEPLRVMRYGRSFLTTYDVERANFLMARLREAEDEYTRLEEAQRFQREAREFIASDKHCGA